MTTLAAHLPPLVNALAFGVIAVVLTLGYVVWNGGHHR